MAQKIKCKVFKNDDTAFLTSLINSFLDNTNREFISATQSESDGGFSGDLNITITIWYKEV